MDRLDSDRNQLDVNPSSADQTGSDVFGVSFVEK